VTQSSRLRITLSAPVTAVGGIVGSVLAQLLAELETLLGSPCIDALDTIQRSGKT